MSTHPCESNYIALAACIITGIPPSLAFKRVFPELEPDGRAKTAAGRALVIEDTEEMIRMKARGMTFKAIGRVFGMNKEAVYKRIKRHEERMGEKG
ncbi:MAG: helix-turn-helix domain-containing protein [Dehalococcoidales bacterium]|jgi:DNA invertase Pin-like site-specific DNA recombinase